MAGTDLSFNVYALDKASKTFLSLADRVDKLGRKLDELDRKKADPTVDVDTRRARANLNDLESRLNKLTFRKALVTVGIAGLPVAVAGVASLGAAAGGATALLGAAGVGAAAFGATAAASLSRVTEAREELAEADADHAAILSSLTAAQRESVRDVNKLAGAWTNFQNQTDPAVLGALGAGMGTLRASLPGLSNLVTPVASAFEDFMGTLRRGVSSGAFEEWTSQIGRLSAGMLTRLGAGAVNAAQGVGHLVLAFSGLGTSMAGGLVGVTRQFERWAASLSGSNGFREFIAYVNRVGPQLASTLGEVGSALLNIGQAAAPFAGPMLTIVSTLARLVNTAAEVNPALVTAAAGIGIFIAASRAFGSAMVAPLQRTRALNAQMLLTPTRAGKAGVALRGLSGAMGGSRGLALAAGTGAIALGGLGTKAGVVGTELSILGTTASGALLGFGVGGPIGAAVGGGIGLLGGLAGAFLGSGKAADAASTSNANYASSLNQVSGAVTQTTRDLVAQRLEQQGVLKDLASLKIDPGLGVEAVLGDRQAIEAITSSIDSQIAAIQRRQKALRSSDDDPYVSAKDLNRLDQLNSKSDELAAMKARIAKVLGVEAGALEREQAALRRSGRAADGYGAAQRDAAGNTRTLTQAVNHLMRAQERQTAQALMASDKNLAFKQAMIDLRKETNRGKKSWNANTQAGIDNRTAVNRSIAAWNDLGAEQQNARGAFKSTRSELIDLATQMNGGNRQAARRYVDSLMEIPRKVVTDSELKKRQAEQDSVDLRRKFGEIPGRTVTEAQFDHRAAVSSARSFARTIGGILGGIRDEPVNVELTGLAKLALSGSGPLFEADGGYIRGAGGPRDDRIPAMLSNGEYVINAAAVGRYGPGLFDSLNAQRYAAGGPVGVLPNVSMSGMGAAIAKIEGGFGAFVDRVGQRLSDKINDAFSVPAFSGGGGSGQWASTAAQALAMLGQPMSLVPTVLRLIQKESGGNPRAINLWDSNAAAGTPSMGLIQTIMPTFLAYNHPGLPAHPYHPLANIYAGLNYALARYGSIAAIDPLVHAGGYAAGGKVSGPGSPTSDSVPLWGSDGEFMVNAAATRQFEPVLEWINAQGLARGGKVTKSERRDKRRERRQDAREADREDAREAREEAREAAREAREDERTITQGLRAFRFGGRVDTRREARDEWRELRRALRQALGKDSPLLDRVERLGGRMEKLGDRLGKLDKTNERLNTRLDKLQDNRDRLRSSVAENFRNDPFSGGLDDFSLQVRADRNDARRMRRALNTAENKGLSGGLYRQLAASGNFTLAAEFARSSRSEIRNLERLFRQRNQASSRAGSMVGRDVFGEQMRDTNRALNRNERATRRNTRAMERQGDRIERAVERGTRAGSRQGGARQRARAR